MRLRLFVFLWWGVLLGNAQQVFEKGKVIDSISVFENSKETFALYLPSSFDASKPSSIVFIFEPAARGKVGITPFIEASEAYNHILICSNTNRNGPYARNFDIANRLFEFVFSNFNVHEDQVFLAGFSGGSRLASTIAVMTNQIAGVIGCGAGFSENQSQMPSIQKFSYVGICGNRDMNYTEMLTVKKYLQQLNFNHTLITYDGNHSWPPSKEILKAFDWLAIQSHKKRIKTKTKEQIFDSYKKNYKIALKAEKENNIVLAIENYERVLLTYPSFYNMDSIYIKYDKLQKSKAYKNSMKSVEKALDKEVKLTTKFNNRFIREHKNPEKADILWWEKELGKLKTIESLLDIEMDKMLERLRYKIFAQAISMKKPNLYTSGNTHKEYLDKIIRLIYPNLGKNIGESQSR